MVLVPLARVGLALAGETGPGREEEGLAEGARVDLEVQLHDRGALVEQRDGLGLLHGRGLHRIVGIVVVRPVAAGREHCELRQLLLHLDAGGGAQLVVLEATGVDLLHGGAAQALVQIEDLDHELLGRHVVACLRVHEPELKLHRRARGHVQGAQVRALLSVGLHVATGVGCLRRHHEIHGVALTRLPAARLACHPLKAHQSPGAVQAPDT
mmetsp:Transcript_101892/g.292362  ORF Transcript_101892/g.292362 Transcript_101892/m.292362 type:complete len:211 (+) Transcript_101892:870-1502(+)